MSGDGGNCTNRETGDDGEEDSEWLEALSEAQSYMDAGYTDEAIDIGVDFGI